MVPSPDPNRDDASTDAAPADRGRDREDRGCPKCGHTGPDVGTISTTGGGLSKMFDVQTNTFKVVSCTNYGYSELYRDDTPGSSDIIDVFLG
jgi:predicted nucleic-acid-binding Zn-ribbon protein